MEQQLAFDLQDCMINIII